MSRVVKKKVIDDSMVFSDNFDETMLDKIEDELGKSLESSGKNGVKRASKRAASAEAGAADQASKTATAVAGVRGLERPTGERPAEPGEASEEKDQRKLPIYRKIAFKKWLAVGIAVVLFVVLPAFSWVLLQRQHQEVQVIQFVRHPVPLPHHQSESKFLVVAEAGGRKDLLEINVQFGFLNTTAAERFSVKRTAIQDSCYRFIQAHNPADNSQRNWARLVQQDLLAQLKIDFPKISIDSITLTQFNRL